MLLDHAKRHALVHWQLYGWGYQGAVAIRRGDVATGLRLLRWCFKELGETGITAPRFMRFAAVDMAEGLGKVGQIADAFDAIDDAIARAERTEELWNFPSCCASKASLLLPGAADRQPPPKHHFRRALDWRAGRAPCHGNCLSRRASLGCSCDQGRSAEAIALLQPVYDSFTEGFDTVQHKSCKSDCRRPPIARSRLCPTLSGIARTLLRVDAVAGGEQLLVGN